MSMFPGAGAQVYYNEAGEPLGWDYPSDPSEYAFDEPDYTYEDDMPFEGCCEAGDYDGPRYGESDTRATCSHCGERVELEVCDLRPYFDPAGG